MEYASYLQQAKLEDDGRIDVWDTSNRKMESLGLCTGLLSAYVASSARNVDNFHTYGAAAVRLGMLVGLVVDSQDLASGKGRS